MPVLRPKSKSIPQGPYFPYKIDRSKESQHNTIANTSRNLVFYGAGGVETAGDSMYVQHHNDDAKKPFVVPYAWTKTQFGMSCEAMTKDDLRQWQ